MREASAEREKALLPAVRVLLSTHALCQKKKKKAYYSRQSLPRSLNKRRRNGTALAWVGSGKDREGIEGGKREARPHKVRYVKGRDKQFMITAKGFLRGLGRNEMRNSYLYSRCKGLAQIAYYSRQSLPRSLNKRRRNGTAPRSWTLGTS